MGASIDPREITRPSASASSMNTTLSELSTSGTLTSGAYHSPPPTPTKLTSSSSSAAPEIHPVLGLHFLENRTVILIAGDKEFRLPLCILTAKSTVFRDHCNAERGTTPPNAILRFKLADPPSHVEYFLRAIFDSGYFEPPPRKINDIDQILGILDLSTRYGVNYLRKRALAHVATGYPTTLADWHETRETSTFIPITDFSANLASINIRKTLTTLQILWKSGVLWLMPAVFYECGRYDVDQLIVHSTWGKGALSDDLKKHIIVGIYKQNERSRRLVSFLHRRSSKGCLRPKECAEMRRHHAEQLLGPEADMPMSSPLTVWDEGDWMFFDVCENCMKDAQEEHAQASEEFWNELPGVYGLAEWGKLLEMKEAAMA